MVNIREIRRITRNRLAAAKSQRATTVTTALHSRVVQRWHTHAFDGNPKAAQSMERSVLAKITGTWERDGTPIAATVKDDWYWKDDTPLFQLHGTQTGFLNRTIVQKCSAACESVADEVCVAKYGLLDSQACSRGRVYRARYEKTGTLGSSSDWFVCRCNSGVLQLSGSESQRWHRSKNSRTTVTPIDITFDAPLHTSEMIDDQYTHCFRDFGDWLYSEPTFSQQTNVSMAAISPTSVDLLPSSNLDALALSPFSDLPTTYDTVKTLWRQTCLKRPMASGYESNTQRGGDDSGIEILHMQVTHIHNSSSQLAVRDRNEYLPQEMSSSDLLSSQPAR